MTRLSTLCHSALCAAVCVTDSIVYIERSASLGGLGRTFGTSPGDACSDEAAGYPEINEASDARHALDSSLSGLNGLATVSVLRMGGSSLDRFRVASAVKPTNWHSVGARVKTATSAAFGSRFALRGPTGGYVG